MRSIALLVLSGLAMAACSSPEDVAEATGTEDAGQQSAGMPASPTPPSPDGAALKVNEDNELYSFDFAYPKQAAEIPALKAQLDREMENAKAELIKLAREGRDGAKDMGFPYNAYASGTDWQVVADTPRFLSLSASLYSYTGGAHPNSNAKSLVWDRETDAPLEPIAFFNAPAALNAAVEEPYCAALNAERAKRRGGVEEGGMFSECPPASELVVMLGSSTGKAFNRIGILAPPYSAGPYAEGEYEVTIPVTRAILEAVKPAYKSAFAAK